MILIGRGTLRFISDFIDTISSVMGRLLGVRFRSKGVERSSWLGRSSTSGSGGMWIVLSGKGGSRSVDSASWCILGVWVWHGFFK